MYDILPYQNERISMSNSKKKKVTLSLDEETLTLLNAVSDTCGYDSISASIRIMVKKYARYELKPIEDDRINRE